MLKNYTTNVGANRSIEEIQTSLVKHGAMGVMYEYEQGTGRIHALKFLLMVKEQKVSFSLPVNWRMFQEVLKREEVSKAGSRAHRKRSWDYQDEDYCYRVAWRCLRDWVLAQMALYETQMVEMPQIFLPFAVINGQTLYDQVSNGKFLLGDGK